MEVGRAESDRDGRTAPCLPFAVQTIRQDEET